MLCWWNWIWESRSDFSGRGKDDGVIAAMTKKNLRAIIGKAAQAGKHTDSERARRTPFEKVD